MAVSEEAVLDLTRWGMKWLKFGFNMAIGNTPDRVYARGLLAAFDATKEDPRELIVTRTTCLRVDEETYVTAGDSSCSDVVSVLSTPVLNEKKSVRIAKGKRTTFAMALAKRAYVKFGARPVSEANVLVTRKWIVKLIEDEFKDLRNCDKAIAVDRATFLSFVPTMAWNNYKFVFHGNNAVTDRIGGESLFSRIAHWANPAK